MSAGLRPHPSITAPSITHSTLSSFLEGILVFRSRPPSICCVDILLVSDAIITSRTSVHCLLVPNHIILTPNIIFTKTDQKPKNCASPVGAKKPDSAKVNSTIQNTTISDTTKQLVQISTPHFASPLVLRQMLGSNANFNFLNFWLVISAENKSSIRGNKNSEIKKVASAIAIQSATSITSVWIPS